MNQLMIQQAVSSVRALQGKTANSAGRGQNVLDFAAIARDALGTDAAATPDKNARDEANPLAALLLAALFTQPLTTTDTDDSAADAQTQGQSNAAVDALTAQTAASTNAPAANENLVTLLRALGMDQAEAQDFAQQLGAVLQTAAKATPNASPMGIAHAAQRSAVWAAARQAAQSAAAETPANGITATGTAAAQVTEALETADPVAQVRHLLGKLLGETVALESTHTQSNAQQPDTKAVLTLRALLADLQAAQQTASTTPAASTQGDTRQDTSGSDDASTDSNATAADATTLNATPATVAFPDLHTADTAVQPPRRTLNEAFDTMVDTITTLRNSDKSEMEIHLKPDFLGKVVIKLTMEEGSLVARISASSSSVQDAFQAQASQLTSSLQQSGIKDVTVLVTHDMASGSALDQSTARQQHNPREQRRRNWAVQDTTEKNDIARATAAYDQFWRNGTINYLA